MPVPEMTNRTLPVLPKSRWLPALCAYVTQFLSVSEFTEDLKCVCATKVFHSLSEPSKDHLDNANKYFPPLRPVENTTKYQMKTTVPMTTGQELRSEALCTWPVGTEGGGTRLSTRKLTYLMNAVRVLYILDRSFNKVSTQLPDGRAVCTSSWKNVTSVPSCMVIAFSMSRFGGTA